MKKLILCVCVFASFMSASAFAKQITNPFYMLQKNDFMSTTYAGYQKHHIKSPTDARYRSRLRILSEAGEYGLSDKAAILMGISNAWIRQNGDVGGAHTHNTNINWYVGGHYDLYHTENYLLQAKITYLQQETHHYNGAYKALNANVKTGYDLGAVLPYVGVWGQLPIAQSTNADDKIQCGAYAGFYADTSFAAIDIAVNYDYHRLDKNHKLYMHTALDFLITDKIAVGGFFDYNLIDKRRHNIKADGHTIGGQVKVLF